jgi:hypothetical protein
MANGNDLFATRYSPFASRDYALSLLRIFVLRRPGGSSEELEPDPIPNSAVKLLSANGTMA